MTGSPRRPCLVAPDSFKGTFTAAQVAAALGRGLEAAGEPPPDLCPVADGGEGTLSVLLTALGGQTGGARVSGPLGDPVHAGFAVIEDGGTAIVEVAGASGLGLVPDDRRGPAAAWAASSRGTGELIVAAARTGAQVVLVAAGGSATTDGGAGAIAAIQEAGDLGGATLVVLCDVRTPFEDAARVFGPQKGADDGTVARQQQRLHAQAGARPRAPRGVPGTGAAGGRGRGPVGGVRGPAAGGRPVRPGRGRLRRAPARRPRGRRRRRTAGRPEPAGEDRRRDRPARMGRGCALPRDRGAGRARRSRGGRAHARVGAHGDVAARADGGRPGPRDGPLTFPARRA